MIRKLTIVFTDEQGLSLQRVHVRPIIRDWVYRLWQGFLQQSRYKRGVFTQPIAEFPALEDLTLDFSVWQLAADEVVVVR